MPHDMIKTRRDRVLKLARKSPIDKGLTSYPAARTPIGIESLLAWAWRDELPKAPALRAAIGHAGPKRMGSAGDPARDLVDNGFGVIADPLAIGAPHPDAVLVWEAVAALDQFELTIPDDWSPLEEFGDLDGHAARLAARAADKLCVMGADGVRRLRRAPRRLIEHHAIMGGCPDWRIDRPELRMVCDPRNGKTKWFIQREVVSDGAFGPIREKVEVDGMSKRGYPLPGAYTRTALEPDPLPALVSRAEYEVWRAALDVLAEDLAGGLSRWAVEPSQRPARPWLAGPSGG